MRRWTDEISFGLYRVVVVGPEALVEQQGEWLRLSDGRLQLCPNGSPASSGPSSGLVAGLAVRGASTVCWRLSVWLRPLAR